MEEIPGMRNQSTEMGCINWSCQQQALEILEFGQAVRLYKQVKNVNVLHTKNRMAYVKHNCSHGDGSESGWLELVQSTELWVGHIM